MACCLAAALFFAALRSVRDLVAPTRRTPDFAPAARRASNGVAPSLGAPAVTRRTARPLLVGLGAGLLAYAVTVDGLVIVGAMTTDATVLVWSLRTGLLAAVSAALLFAGRGAWRSGSSVIALAASGAAWSVASIAEMHVVPLTILTDQSLLADLLFHGVGLLPLAVIPLLLIPVSPASPTRHQEAAL